LIPAFSPMLADGTYPLNFDLAFNRNILIAAVTEFPAVDRLGFKVQPVFSEDFRAHFGPTPPEYLGQNIHSVTENTFSQLIDSGSGTGRKEIRGGAGNDGLFGGDDVDLIFGDADDDGIAGNGGNDILIGGDGNDLFLLTRIGIARRQYPCGLHSRTPMKSASNRAA
jgi:hypothetical protein